MLFCKIMRDYLIMIPYLASQSHYIFKSKHKCPYGFGWLFHSNKLLL